NLKNYLEIKIGKHLLWRAGSFAQVPNPVAFRVEVTDFVALLYAEKSLAGIRNIFIIRLDDGFALCVGESVEAFYSDFRIAVFKLTDTVVFRWNNFNTHL